MNHSDYDLARPALAQIHLATCLVAFGTQQVQAEAHLLEEDCYPYRLARYAYVEVVESLGLGLASVRSYPSRASGLDRDYDACAMVRTDSHACSLSLPEIAGQAGNSPKWIVKGWESFE